MNKNSFIYRLAALGMLSAGVFASTATSQIGEDCLNGFDDDGNGLVDCEDDQCSFLTECGARGCGDGATDTSVGESCDDANFVDGDGCDALCQTEPGFVCTGDPSQCFIPGNGDRTAGEQCDDGNLNDGDGCSGSMQLEALSVVTSPADQPDLFNTTPSSAVFSVFIPLQGILDLDGDGTTDTSLMVVLTTDRPDICDIVRDAGGFFEFETLLFGGGVEGTVSITAIQQPSALGPFAGGTFIGTAPIFTNATATSTDSGYIVTSGGVILSDTTFGSDGLGTINVSDFSVVNLNIGGALVPTGNLTADFTNINQVTQFANGGVTAIAPQPISGTLQAATCGRDFF